MFIQITHLFIQKGHTKKKRRGREKAKKERGTKRNVKTENTEIALFGSICLSFRDILRN